MDKDLFRFNLGDIKEAYKEVLKRLKDAKWK
jgi:phosphoribosylaminoimidazole-succinocarboxamide synthase